MAGALDVVAIGRAFGLVDVRIDADARLVDADEIITARCALAHESVLGKVRCR